MPNRRQHDLRGKGQRGNHRPRSDSPVVRTVRNTTRPVIEKATLDARNLPHRPAGSIARGQTPEILAVARECERVVNRILVLNVSRSPAVLEVVDALAAHEGILDSTEIDP